MNHDTFRQFRDLIYQSSGIDLAPGKEPLLRGRVSKRMRSLGMLQEREYLHYVLGDASGDELVLLLDAVSTNVTHFFREREHFDLLTTVLNERLAAGQRRFRIWSAACSTGEEPYSIGMTALRVLASQGAGNVDLRLLATDLSTRVLNKAQQGKYSASDVERVPADLRKQYFQATRAADDSVFTVNDALRRLVTFRRLNLSQPPFPMQGPFDLIFCRNVMIYFDRTVRARLIAEMERLLCPGGLLMIGHSESLAGIDTSLRTMRPSVYQKAN